ncbi:type II secretion system F family protein [Pseudomonas gingeri]|uniref:Type II secretion system F family protein n=1 Tax=Pseudomonas gingeri TaxID=117681 RepID=A0A7Y8BSS5_9PSED|nr:type II secretion system F family protein [Pseudomonas gingeri]NWB86536.1 type II secretion system F family protein [Pseudomonas gingeri]
MTILASALLLFAALTLAAGQWMQRRRCKRAVTRRLQGHMSRDNRFGNLLRRLGESRFGQHLISMDNETLVLLNRVGWRKASQRSLFAASQIATPVLALGIVSLLEGVLFPDTTSPWIAPFLALAGGYLFPKRLLVVLARRRQKQVVQEISTFIPLLRILFESGMAVEQALRVLSQEGRELLPVVTGELRLVLARVDSGLELGEELNKVAGLLEVDEFDDICVILHQLIHQGGGAMKSLLALKQLLDDRRLTRQQEYISKLSAKMSVVMMVFLFPALLIVLAGPGFTALAKAFGAS